LLAIAVAIGVMGPGSYSLDALFGITYPQPLLFVILAVAALLVDLVGMAISRPAVVAPSASDARSKA